MVLLSFISSFFAPCGINEPAGVFTAAHFLASGLTFFAVFIALYFTVGVKKQKIRLIIKWLSASLWILEAVKIAVLLINGSRSINELVPLYFCSIVLYASALSGFFSGKARRAGDVFLACGAVVGGAVFLALPLSSFGVYPLFHFVTAHSLFLHAAMLYMGLLLSFSGSVILFKQDILYYAPLVFLVAMAALAVNTAKGSNLMFISRNYPGTPIEMLYRLLPQPLFTVVTVAGQITLPFYAGWLLQRIFLKRKNKESKF